MMIKPPIQRLSKNTQVRYTVADYKKWESAAVSDYYIYGLPTFTVLDKGHKIVGKYALWEEAIPVLEKDQIHQH